MHIFISLYVRFHHLETIKIEKLLTNYRNLFAETQAIHRAAV